MSLKGQRILLLGGSSGIGLATARLLLEEKASPVLVSRSSEKLQKAQKELGPLETYALDISCETSMASFFSKIGPLDHLVVTAGVSLRGPFFEQTTPQAHESFASKFWGSYYAAKYGAPLLRSSLVFFSGISGTKALPHNAIRSAVNGAIESLGRSLAIELAPLRVNMVAPGVIETPRITVPSEVSRDSLLKELSQKIPLKRVGQSHEAALAVLYLLQNDYVTGETLFVDGGYGIRLP